jgi:hypothetical protein
MHWVAVGHNSCNPSIAARLAHQVSPTRNFGSDLVNLDQQSICITMAQAQPFNIQVPEEELEYLQQRLQSARYPDQLTNIAG